MKIKGKHKVSRAALIRIVKDHADQAAQHAGHMHPSEATPHRNAVALNTAILLAALRQAKLPAEVEITHAVDE